MLCRPPLPSCQELSDVITQVFTFLTVSLELREIDRNPADCVCVHVWCGEERECVCLQGEERMCVCVCVWWGNGCVCRMCVCACEGERKKVCMCACVCGGVEMCECVHVCMVGKWVCVHNVCVCTAGRWVGCVERMCVCERWGSNVCL